MNSPATFVKPSLHQLAPELFRISRARRVFTLILPFLYVALYFIFAGLGWWPLAVVSLIALSFVTYGSISHDLVHRNLGLPKSVNDVFLSVIELVSLRSGHAYRVAHLHHHARFPYSDDIEGAAAGMSFLRTMLEGMIFQFKIWCWAVKRPSQHKRLIVLEGFGCLLLVTLALVLYPVTLVPLAYVVLMIMGSWIIPLITSHIPHDPQWEKRATPDSFVPRQSALLSPSSTPIIWSIISIPRSHTITGRSWQRDLTPTFKLKV